jgi:zinc protease
MIGLQTRVNQADDAVKVVRESLQSYLKDGPGDEELTLSKRNITGGFPLRIASNSDIVEYLAVIGFYDLPLDYLDRFNGYIEAVGKEDIIAAYQRNIFPENMVTVIVGGPDKISAQ